MNDGNASRTPPATRTSRLGARRNPPWKLILWAALAVYAVIFLLMNSDRQAVNFVFFKVETRLIWLILLSMALGAALALVGPHWWDRRRRGG